ncbi:MAG: ABC transporter permease [Acetobacteraceae bacterium]|nr:ABC transporter permease [Acetobacteraceae bacterium]
MLLFVVSRILQALPVFLCVVLVAFVLFAFVGDPVLIMLGQNYTEAQRAATAHRLGLDQPLIIQYCRYVWATLHGEFGVSYRLSRPVAALLAERLPATAELAITATLLSVAVGVPLGVFTAVHRRRRVAGILLSICLVALSVPTFLLGTLLILVFSVGLHWLPSFGRGAVVHIGWWSTGLLTASGLRSLVLPAATLGLYQKSLITRLTRVEMLDALGTEHIRFARARGLPRRSIYVTHAGRNALVPIVTLAALQFGGVLAFSIVTESVFQWPGLGLLFIQSLGAADIPVLAAYLILTAAIFLTLNLAVDLSSTLIDPRLRSSLRGFPPARDR